MRTILRILLKTLKVAGITIGAVIVLMFILPYLFPQAVNRKIDQWANNNINGHITFSHTRLSFFKHFPSLTLSMYDVTLKGSAPFEQDTLLAARNLGLGIDISSLFKSKITINKIFLNDAYINIEVDSAGRANYNIYKPKAATADKSTDTSGASLGINKIDVVNARLVYNDRSLPMSFSARGFNYLGSGDLSTDIFKLNTHMDIQLFDFSFNNEAYIVHEKINADLITEVNTKSFALVFQKNNLMIDEMPVEFNGRFGVIDNGYDIDLHIRSRENDISDILTALPDKYQQPFDKTEINGVSDLQIALTGKYIAKDTIMPDLTMSLKVKDGFISNEKSPAPVQNLYLDMVAKMPHLNADSLSVNIDSLHFNVADGYVNAAFKLRGIKEPYLYARVNAEIDLDKWKRAMGVKPFDVKGKYSLHMLAEGKYATTVVSKGLRGRDTVISSIPKFTLRSSFTNGYFKYASLPGAITDAHFDLKADCPDNNYKHISIALNDLGATALNSYVKGYFRLSNADNFPIDAMVHTSLKLDDLKKFFPIDSTELKGDLTTDVAIKGNYLPKQKRFPVMTTNIVMKDGSVKTKYYPHPIEHIQISSRITDKTGTLNGLNVSVKPLTFSFEGEPFSLKAELHNFSDLQYSIDAVGVLNIGNIYKVFSKKGYDVTGKIAANLSLRGKQSDATAGRYNKLYNKGTLKMQNITCSTELYPKPFVISTGTFSFDQGNVNFKEFAVKYAHSSFILNGALSNVIDYALKPKAVLKGSFDMKSDLIVVDDFMAFADTAHTAAAPSTSTAPSGVVLTPKNLDLTFTAEVKKVKYSDIVLTDVKGQVMLTQDSLLLKETGFNIVGSPIAMDAVYTDITPQKAFFNYHIKAKDLDVKKAYKNIKIFRDLASSAKYAEGLISLDYQLSGDLNSSMMPVYPSLKGGGVLSAKKIGMHGFRLFNAIGKQAGKDSLGSNSEASRLEIKSNIAHNIITIQRTKMRIAGFRARFEGQVSFDKQLNLKFRLGLPPLGIIGIPMTITGTTENPKTHLGKGKTEDDLQGTDDDDKE